MAVFDFLRQKFKQSHDYKYEMLLRDLREMAEELNAILGSSKARTAWTPILHIAGGTTGITYTTQRGSYVRVGQIVHAEFEIQLLNKGALVGNAEIRNLPISNAADRQLSMTVGYYAAMNLTAGNVLALLGYANGAGGNGVAIRQHGATGTTNVTDAMLTNTSRIIASGTWLAPD